MSLLEMSVETEEKSPRKKRTWLLFLFALLLNFTCIFTSVWLANIIQFSRKTIDGTMLAERSADYGVSPGDRTPQFQPLDNEIFEAIATDEANLQ